MYNYFKINDCLINNLAKVHIVDKQILSPKAINTIQIGSRDGHIFNGSAYEPLEVTVSLFIEAKTSTLYEEKINTLKDIFSIKEICPLSFREGTSMYGIVSSEFRVAEKTLLSGYSTITVMCYVPVCYSDNLQLFDNSIDSTKQSVSVINNGGMPTLPFMSIGFTKDTYYVQVEKVSTGERILIGEYPQLTLTSVQDTLLVLSDPCETLGGWTNSTPSIDSDRTSGGTFGITSGGTGICLSTLPSSSSTTWRGGCYRITLPSNVDDFQVSGYLRHDSTGKNGDPTLPDVLSDGETITSGTKSQYYQVTCSSLNVRSGGGTNYKILGSLKRGHQIKTYTLNKGWIKFTYNGKDGYVKESYCKIVQTDTTVDEYAQNMVVTSVTGLTNLRATPSVRGSLVTTIGTGEVVRVISSKTYTYYEVDEKGDTQTWYYYKLQKKYKDKYDGYISTFDISYISDVAIEYDYSDDYAIADDKTGVLELYGFDINGSKLFKIQLIDEQPYFEYTKPVIQIGNKIVAQDTTNVPNPKSKTINDNGTIKTTRYLSNRLGDWNELYCKVEISRKKVNSQDVWDVTLQKILDGVVVNTLSAHNLKDTTFPTGNLSYLAVYMGTQSDSMNKSCAMSISDLKVYNTNNAGDTVSHNKVYFNEGDLLEIDFENRDVYINETKRNDLIDIGSRFFNIDTGEDTIKINSNDTGTVATVVFREMWLGSTN